MDVTIRLRMDLEEVEELWRQWCLRSRRQKPQHRGSLRLVK
jgi:hypothetical protein